MRSQRRWMGAGIVVLGLLWPEACGLLPQRLAANPSPQPSPSATPEATASSSPEPSPGVTPRPLPSPLRGIGRGAAIPIPEGIPSTPSASPSIYDRIPFAFPPGPFAHVAVYDRMRQDVFFYPGSLRGAENVFEWNPGQYYYDDGRNIFLLDTWREEQVKLVDGHEVGGFAFLPSFDSNNHLYFLGQSNRKLAGQSIGWAYTVNEPPSTVSVDVATWDLLPSPPPAEPGPYLGKVFSLTKINALAELHGELTSIGVDGPGDRVVFTTGDGGLYLYDVGTHQVLALIPDELIEGGVFATAAVIDPIWGRYVAWADTRGNRIWVLDRWTGHYDPVPYANIALGAVAASAPNFYGNDPYNVVFTLTLKDGTTRLIDYSLLTERVVNLTILNAFSPLKPLYLK